MIAKLAAPGLADRTGGLQQLEGGLTSAGLPPTAINPPFRQLGLRVTTTLGFCKYFLCISVVFASNPPFVW